MIKTLQPTTKQFLIEVLRIFQSTIDCEAKEVRKKNICYDKQPAMIPNLLTYPYYSFIPVFSMNFHRNDCSQKQTIILSV